MVVNVVVLVNVNVVVVVEWERREEEDKETCDFAPFSSLPIHGCLLSGPGLFRAGPGWSRSYG